MSDVTLEIAIKNRNPVELLDYTDSLSSLCTLYNKYIYKHPELSWESDAKLYVQTIKSGSIITTLQDLIPLVVPFAENSNNIVDFAKHLKSILYSVINKKDEETGIVPTMPSADIQDLKSAVKFINPIAKDGGAQLNVAALNFYGNPIINITLSSMEAQAGQNSLGMLIEEMKEPVQSQYSKVIFTWYIAKNDLKSKSGDKGIIERISHTPCKVIFDNEIIKSEMIDMDENPLHKAFVVDVEVGTVQGKPVSFKILKMHEYFDL